MARFFGAPEIDPPGKHSTERRDMSDVFAQFARDGRNQMKNLLKTFESEQLWHMDTPVSANAPEIIALQVR
jgi:hypothetical protein